MNTGVTTLAAESSDTLSQNEIISQNTVIEKITIDDLIKHLNSIDFGQDITFTELPQSKTTENLLQFNSLEDAEKYLRNVIEQINQFATTPEIVLQTGMIKHIDNESLVKNGPGWYNGDVRWWGGGNTSLFSLTNAEVTFYYDGSNMSNISVTDSYMLGFVGATWTHRSGSATPLGGLNAKYSVTGTWLITLSIFGLPIGASFNETLQSPTITMTLQ